jgi:hypothetical protein
MYTSLTFWNSRGRGRVGETERERERGGVGGGERERERGRRITFSKITSGPCTALTVLYSVGQRKGKIKIKIKSDFNCVCAAMSQGNGGVEALRGYKHLYASIYVSSSCYICVLILLYMCPHTAIYVSSYCYICVLILLYVS